MVPGYPNGAGYWTGQMVQVTRLTILYRVAGYDPSGTRNLAIQTVQCTRPSQYRYEIIGSGSEYQVNK